MSRYWKKIPSFKALLAIEAVERLGSFSKAGDELNVSQSAVSHAVRNLEDVLHVKLIERKRRPVRVTEAGKRYVEALRSGLSELERAYDIVTPSRDTPEIVVSGNLGVITYWLIPKLKAFREDNPNIGVSFVTTYDGVPSLDFQTDVALRFGDGKWSDCESQLLFDEEITPVASPSYLDTHTRIKTVTDLLDHTLLQVRSRDPSWVDWAHWFAANGITVEDPLPGPTFDNHLFMMQAALNGEGIAVGWTGTSASFIETGQLKPLPLLKARLAPQGIYAVRQLQRQQNSYADLLWDWLEMNR